MCCVDCKSLSCLTIAKSMHATVNFVCTCTCACAVHYAYLHLTCSCHKLELFKASAPFTDTISHTLSIFYVKRNRFEHHFSKMKCYGMFCQCHYSNPRSAQQTHSNGIAWAEQEKMQTEWIRCITMVAKKHFFSRCWTCQWTCRGKKDYRIYEKCCEMNFGELFHFFRSKQRINWISKKEQLLTNIEPLFD